MAAGVTDVKAAHGGPELPKLSLAGAHPQQVDLELGEGSQDVEEHLAHGVGRVVDLPAEGELDSAGGQRVADLSGIRYRAGEPVEFRNPDAVARPSSCQCLTHP